MIILNNDVTRTFFQACKNGDAQALEELMSLEARSTFLGQNRKVARLGMAWACYGGHTEVVKLLYEAAVAYRSRYGYTDPKFKDCWYEAVLGPFHRTWSHAVYAKKLDTAEWLLRVTPRVFKKGRYVHREEHFSEAFLAAAQFNLLEIMQWLWAKAPTSISDQCCKPALVALSNHGNLAAIQWLVSLSFNLLTSDLKPVWTRCLDSALEWSHVNVARWIVDEKALLGPPPIRIRELGILSAVGRCRLPNGRGPAMLTWIAAHMNHLEVDYSHCIVFTHMCMYGVQGLVRLMSYIGCHLAPWQLSLAYREALEVFTREEKVPARAEVLLLEAECNRLGFEVAPKVVTVCQELRWAQSRARYWWIRLCVAGRRGRV